MLIPFTDPIDTPEWKGKVARYSPAGKVPALVDGDVAVWESLAIMDHLADTHPDLAIWPRERAARAMARSVAAEMHAGFGALRGACPMNLGKRFAAKDRGPAVAKDVARIVAIWTTARERFGAGRPLPVRGLLGRRRHVRPRRDPLRHLLGRRAARSAGTTWRPLFGTPAFREWREAALAETWIVPEDEVDEEPVEVLRRAG